MDTKTVYPLKLEEAQRRGKGDQLAVIKVWSETKRLIDLSAGTFPGMSRTEIYDRAIRLFLQETGRLGAVEALARVQAAADQVVSADG